MRGAGAEPPRRPSPSPAPGQAGGACFFWGGVCVRLPSLAHVSSLALVSSVTPCPLCPPRSPAVVPLPQPGCPGTVFPQGVPSPGGPTPSCPCCQHPRAFEPAVVDFYIFFPPLNHIPSGNLINLGSLGHEHEFNPFLASLARCQAAQQWGFGCVWGHDGAGPVHPNRAHLSPSCHQHPALAACSLARYQEWWQLGPGGTPACWDCPHPGAEVLRSGWMSPSTRLELVFP